MSRKWFLCVACLVSVVVSGCRTAGTSMTANSPLGDLLKKKEASGNGVSQEYKTASTQLSDPENVLLAYAMWKEESEQYGEARAKYQDIVNANPSNLPATLGLARTEYRSGRRTQGMEILKKAAQDFPNNPDVYREQAAFYAHAKDWDSAIAAYQKAAELNPNHADGRYRLGTALAHAGRIDEALPHLSYSVGDAAAYYNLGYILFQQDRTSEARQFFERSLQESPSPETQARASQMLARFSTPNNPSNYANYANNANYGVMARTGAAAAGMNGNFMPAYPNSAPQQLPTAQLPTAPVVTAPDYAAGTYTAEPALNAQPWQPPTGMQPTAAMQPTVTPAGYSRIAINAAGTASNARRASTTMPAVVPPLPSSFDRAVSSAMGFSAQNAPQANYASQQQPPANGTQGVVVPSNWQR